MRKIKVTLFSLLVIFSLNSAAQADETKREVLTTIDEIKEKFGVDLFMEYRTFLSAANASQRTTREAMAEIVRKIAVSLIKSYHYSCDCPCGCFDMVEALDPVYKYLKPNWYAERENGEE